MDPGFTCQLTVSRMLTCAPTDSTPLSLSFEFEPLVDHWYILILQADFEGSTLSIRNWSMETMTRTDSEEQLSASISTFFPSSQVTGI